MTKLRIQEALDERGVSRRQLAMRIGITAPSMSAMLNKDSLSFSNLVRIADALDCPVSELIEDERAAQQEEQQQQHIICPHCGKRIKFSK